MGIKLDWEVESEGGWDEVGEDPRAVEARRRRARRLRNTLLLVLVLLLVLGAVVGYRLFTVAQQVREALRAAVAAETVALRIGDREAYLLAQSNLGGWRQVQDQAFQQYQAEGTRVNATGQIVQMDISADRARVTLREVVDGKPYNVMWFYQRDASGWKHVAPDPHFWGDQREHHSTYFDFDYFSEDQALIDVLDGQLDTWWTVACDLTQCTGKPPSIEVKVEPDRLATVGWAQYDANTLIIPSPLLGRFPADGRSDPLLSSQLADLIAYRWAEYLMGKEVRANSEIDWLRSEVHWWLRNSFDPTQPPAPMLTPLVQAYGKQIFSPLAMRIKRGDPVVLVLQEQTGASAADLAVGWELYLTYRLRDEISLLQGGNETEAILLYRDPERPHADAAVISSVGQADSDTIRVIGLRRYGNLVWGETVFSGIAPAVGQRSLDTTMTIFLPFRLLDDRWVHTVATLEDWGPAREDRGEHIIVRYYDLDALTGAGLLASLEQAYDQVVADMGNPADLTGTPVLILVDIAGYDLLGNVIPFVDPDLGEEQSTTPGVLSVQLPSPYSRHYAANGNTQEVLRSEIIPHLVGALVGPTLPPGNPLRHAFQQWEISRFGLEADNILSPVFYCDPSFGADACYPPESLEELWQSNVGYVRRDDVAAEVLLGLLIERYGEDVVARLAPNLSQAGSMDDWLYRSLGIHAADIEAEWLTRVRILYSSSP